MFPICTASTENTSRILYFQHWRFISERSQYLHIIFYVLHIILSPFKKYLVLMNFSWLTLKCNHWRFFWDIDFRIWIIFAFKSILNIVEILLSRSFYTIIFKILTYCNMFKIVTEQFCSQIWIYQKNLQERFSSQKKLNFIILYN